MNIKKWAIVFILTLAVISAFFIFSNKQQDNGLFTTEVFNLENGFGYKINYNSKVLIKQNYIPAVQSNKTFCSARDAEQVANLVIEKLKAKKSPNITLQNLNQLNINLNCNN